MATKILTFGFNGKSLLLGNEHDARQVDPSKVIVINVLEEKQNDYDITIPILKRLSDDTPKRIIKQSGNWLLDWNKVFEATDIIEKSIKENPNKDVLLHCGAGQERSPLVMQYYLVRYHNMGADKAFNYIKERRPEIFRCDLNYAW